MYFFMDPFRFNVPSTFRAGIVMGNSLIGMLFFLMNVSFTNFPSAPELMRAFATNFPLNRRIGTCKLLFEFNLRITGEMSSSGCIVTASIDHFKKP